MTGHTYPITTQPGWRDRAQCRDMNPDEFDAGPSGDDPSLTALAACERCPVKAECLDDAMRTERNGYRAEVRAGLTPAQRDALARRRRA
jgi:hypothetical protein